MDRRPLKTRSRPSARALASVLARRGVKPNHVSLAGIGFALLAAAALVGLPHATAAVQALLLVGAAVAIQLRLLCNLVDGMIAVENGLKTATGELYNDVPDRFADVLIIAAAGYAIAWDWGGPLGWAAAAAALLTAYVRVLGGALGTPQHFFGPMAKPHRMAVLTAACLLSLVEVAASDFRGRILAAALGVVLVGSLATFARRLQLIAVELNAR
ncbi:MAG: CDP-alcohol phosphatidyltransferase family protein [Actinobacteria bacterium]|nr:MAG: CDP-alcohol phosphatidyltransferase family protein [Actinomycetota bacterium]